MGDKMGHLTDGYVTSLVYKAYYFNDLSPNFLRALLLLCGHDLPKREAGEPLRYLELGFGQGLSVNIHAACVDGEFWGTDFNAEQVDMAQEIATAAELSTKLLEDSFASFREKSDAGELPQFDIITLHGIWSWISDENREHILKIIEKNLKSGGVVYVSYNALPGWSLKSSLRELLVTHCDIFGEGRDDITKTFQDAMKFVGGMEDKLGFFTKNPAVVDAFAAMKPQDPSYLMHEYMNTNSDPFYFKHVSKMMNGVGCSFLTTSRFGLLDRHKPEVMKIIESDAPVEWRETIRDFSSNTAFRCDVFVKDMQQLDLQDHQEQLFSRPIVLAKPLEKLPAADTDVSKGVEFLVAHYRPVLEYIASNNYTPKSLYSIMKHEICANMSAATFKGMILLLLSQHTIRFAQRATPEVKERCAKLNKVLCSVALTHEYSQYLASPILGCGVSVPRIQQMFLHARASGSANPTNWATYVGKRLNPTKDKNYLATLKTSAKEFEEVYLPYLNAMGAILSHE